MNIKEVLTDLLLSNKVGTQEEIKNALEMKGFEVNQSKISRLLHKLGAVKVMNDQKQIVYSLPREPTPTKSQALLSETIIKISNNETLIVIQTHPGAASLIARILDHHTENLEILGTIAGDDTLFIAPNSVKNIQEIIKKIKSFLTPS